MHIVDVEVNQPAAIYIDAIFLSNPAHTIPLLAANFLLYEKYFVHTVSAEFVPSQPVTVGGTVGMAPDYDPIDPMPATMAALSASQGYKTGPVTSGMKVTMPNYRGPDGNYIRPDLYTNPTHDDRLTSFGQFKLFAVAPTLNTGDVVGKIILHYDITFHILEPQSSMTFTTPVVDRFTAGGAALRFLPDMMRGSTQTDKLTFSDVGGNLTVPADKLLTGIIDTVGAGIPMITVAGKQVNSGTRVFARPCTHTLDTDAVETSLDNSEYVGALSVSRTFQSMSNIVMPLVNTVATILRDVQLI